MGWLTGICSVLTSVPLDQQCPGAFSSGSNSCYYATCTSTDNYYVIVLRMHTQTSRHYFSCIFQEGALQLPPGAPSMALFCYESILFKPVMILSRYFL